ncbi:hypothetical protein QBC45DRAFT_459222 [Copromyces sp. CBS 386.78]|nr:hypothetical protein QBC45DRAFT_459222 [Copromyces sp. CBS 386.78]
MGRDPSESDKPRPGTLSTSYRVEAADSGREMFVGRYWLPRRQWLEYDKDREAGDEREKPRPQWRCGGCSIGNRKSNPSCPRKRPVRRGPSSGQLLSVQPLRVPRPGWLWWTGGHCPGLEVVCVALVGGGACAARPTVTSCSRRKEHSHVCWPFRWLRHSTCATCGLDCVPGLRQVRQLDHRVSKHAHGTQSHHQGQFWCLIRRTTSAAKDFVFHVIGKRKPNSSKNRHLRTMSASCADKQHPTAPMLTAHTGTHRHS